VLWPSASGNPDTDDVYFGTNPNPGPSEFQGNQTQTTFVPGYLGKNTWYYWPIDEVNAGETNRSFRCWQNSGPIRTGPWLRPPRCAVSRTASPGHPWSVWRGCWSSSPSVRTDGRLRS